MAEKLKNKVTDGFQKGHPYGELPPCIHVGILNFNQMISPNYYHKFCLMDEKTKEIYSRKFQFHMIELKKLKYVKEKQKKKPLYRWAKLIAAQTWEELEQESKGNKYMERALEEMIKISQDERERYLYLREEMAESDRASQIQSAQRIGRKEGEILKLISLVQKKILKMVLPKLKNQFKINRLVDFNPIGVADEEIEILNKESVTDVGTFVKTLDDGKVCKEIENLQIDKVSFYCLRVVYEGKCVYLLRQFSKMKKLRSGLLTPVSYTHLTLPTIA